MVDKLENITLDEIPRYLDAYQSCIVTYNKNRNLIIRNNIIPPDAMLLKDIYNNEKKMIIGTNSSLESRLKNLEQIGLVKISGNYASLTPEGRNAKYTFIPRPEPKS